MIENKKRISSRILAVAGCRLRDLLEAKVGKRALETNGVLNEGFSLSGRSSHKSNSGPASRNPCWCNGAVSREIAMKQSVLLAFSNFHKKPR